MCVYQSTYQMFKNQGVCASWGWVQKTLAAVKIDEEEEMQGWELDKIPRRILSARGIQTSGAR